MMISLLSLALFSLLIQRHIVSSQSTPYEIRFTSPAPGGNAITLQCSGTHGTPVAGASFYRNSQGITNSSCLTAYPTSGSSELRVELQSQECDGFFSCGLNGILSLSQEFHACPVKNVTETTTVEIEEGSSALLTCNFFPSPIKNYTTEWFIGIGSNARPIENSTSEHLQSYLLQKPDQPNKYYCKIQIQSSTNSRCSPSDISSIIMVQLKKKYEMPTITQDLNYTMDSNGEGAFTVTSRGTNLTHKWYKDGGLINSTGDSILEISDTSLRVKEVNGSLRIAYVVSNVDYDNTSHSMRQAFGVYNVSCGGITEDSMETLAVPIMGTVIGILIIICLILVLCLYIIYKKYKSASEKTVPVEFTRRDGSTVTEGNNDMRCDEVGGLQRLAEVTHSSEQCDHGCMTCNYEESMKPDERLSLFAMRMVKDCTDESDFLKLLLEFLLKAKYMKKYNNKCRELCSKMIHEVDTLMEEIEPQERDATRKIGLDGSNEHLLSDNQLSNDQHDRYKQYQDIRKILQEIASK
ncbi:PREDICTED: uncharacterized protein LOC109580387 isoform X2 [Amphimedon queenslandica]|uniref:Ig-like domain-containing protein n=2 Tax=Amphimedon queenslandica TaxID=400682 RepID=A0AAN0IW56_AMPQE|nr:PREDICTED: uncharacterized protein LOC109580387 isoform X2 [Amphimedon queenslandica]|eukprot:XP_019849020.1 PREDICTED: uncharacterized protein LOC109580387 isoform X2 [Amphimedon queenslandica]